MAGCASTPDRHGEVFDDKPMVHGQRLHEKATRDVMGVLPEPVSLVDVLKKGQPVTPASCPATVNELGQGIEVLAALTAPMFHLIGLTDKAVGRNPADPIYTNTVVPTGTADMRANLGPDIAALYQVCPDALQADRRVQTYVCYTGMATTHLTGYKCPENLDASQFPWNQTAAP
ncbi:MAG: hypothetical protein M3O22_02825 [Pseudomonadota bacterium]|nr:hypothetical protein [Pseudomonadota bacterium]